jgi:hypothetical protein
MPSRKLITSVLRGFLGTYVSRYSEFNGYLLFGFVVDSLDGLEVDLTALAGSVPSHEPIDEVRRLACRKFREQLSKVGLPLSVVRTAMVTIRKGAVRQTPLALVFHGLTMVSGFEMHFVARVVTDLGRVYEVEVCEVIAPQDPVRFSQSQR